MSEDKNLGNSELNAADELTNAPLEQQPVEYTDDNIRQGNKKMMENIGAQWHDCNQVGTIIHVAIDGKYAGHHEFLLDASHQLLLKLYL